MNIAVIFAGGTGQRMNSKTKPKQFLEVHGKPILIYTLEKFENNNDVDAIILVCLEKWIEYANTLLNKYGLKKVKSVISGGKTGQESIYKGLEEAKLKYGNGNIVLIHDGVRPLIDNELITKCIDVVKKNGTAITVSPATETITIKSDDKKKVASIIEREKCELAKAPQCFWLDEIFDAHNKAIREKKNDFIDSASIMQYYGYPLYTVRGNNENIKITTPIDYYIFKAVIDAKENSQIFGF